MSNFNYQEYLRNNPLLKSEVKDSLITESKEVTEEETLNEGVFDKVKEKVLKVADKIKNKFSADEIAKMKDAVKKALGKDKLELSDITLDNLKKVVNVMKDQLAEGQLEESLGDKITKVLASTGMVGGLAAAIIGGSLGTLSAPLVIGGLIAMIIGGIIGQNLDEEITEEETLNEGVFDKVKEKVLKVADKIKNKFSADEIAKMKDAVKKALGKDKLELSDITLDNLKKVVNVMKDQLAEGQLEESLGDKITKVLASTGMVGGLAAAIIGGSLGTLSAPLVIGGLIAMIIGGIIGQNLDEEITEKEVPSSKMKVSELKAKIKEDIISLLQEEEEEDVEVDVEDEVDVDVEEPALDTPSEDAGLSQDEQDIQDSLKLAYDNAVAIGDQKLADQIGNSITFFTRTHVVER